MLKQSDVVSGSAYIHMFSTAQPVCLLVGAFNPFTFKVIIDMYDLFWVCFFVGLFLFLCFLTTEVPLAFVVKLVR